VERTENGEVGGVALEFVDEAFEALEEAAGVNAACRNELNG
jgi:hypothetical protein